MKRTRKTDASAPKVVFVPLPTGCWIFITSHCYQLLHFDQSGDNESTYPISVFLVLEMVEQPFISLVLIFLVFLE